jgi:hypothetical protein
LIIALGLSFAGGIPAADAARNKKHRKSKHRREKRKTRKARQERRRSRESHMHNMRSYEGGYVRFQRVPSIINPKEVKIWKDLTSRAERAGIYFYQLPPAQQRLLSREKRHKMAEQFMIVASAHPPGTAQHEFNRARAMFLLSKGPSPGTNVNRFAEKHGYEKFHKTNLPQERPRQD